jgi:hypothetical protein
MILTKSALSCIICTKTGSMSLWFDLAEPIMLATVLVPTSTATSMALLGAFRVLKSRCTIVIEI